MKITWITFAKITNNNSTLHTTTASARYRILIPAKALLSHNHISEVCGVDMDFDKICESVLKSDVVIFSKSLDVRNEEIMRLAKDAGIRVLFDICDNHFQHREFGEHFHEMTRLADDITVSTAVMGEIVTVATRRQAYQVRDPYEGTYLAPRFKPVKNSLNLLWYGHPANFDTLVQSIPSLTEYAQRNDCHIDLVLVTAPVPMLVQFCQQYSQVHGKNIQVQFVPWSIDTLQAALSSTDLVIIPQLGDTTKLVKSSNRLVEALWAGRAVVASPIPAYMEFSDWAVITNNLVAGIHKLRMHPEKVVSRVAQGQEYIKEYFSPERVVKEWLQAIKGGAISD